MFVNFFITISVDKRKVQNVLYIKTQEGIYMCNVVTLIVNVWKK